MISIAFLLRWTKVPRPDGKEDSLGLTVLDEPSSKQSDPHVLGLQMLYTSNQPVAKSLPTVKKKTKWKSYLILHLLPNSSRMFDMSSTRIKIRKQLKNGFITLANYKRVRQVIQFSIEGMFQMELYRHWAYRLIDNLDLCQMLTVWCKNGRMNLKIYFEKFVFSQVK